MSWKNLSFGSKDVIEQLKADFVEQQKALEELQPSKIVSQLSQVKERRRNLEQKFRENKYNVLSKRCQIMETHRKQQESLKQSCRRKRADLTSVYEAKLRDAQYKLQKTTNTISLTESKSALDRLNSQILSKQALDDVDLDQYQPVTPPLWKQDLDDLKLRDEIRASVKKLDESVHNLSLASAKAQKVKIIQYQAAVTIYEKQCEMYHSKQELQGLLKAAQSELDSWRDPS